MIISFDTETNGVDFFHGAMPFYVTTCDEKGNQRNWEWRVNPLTREVDVDSSDVNEIKLLLEKADRIIGQNAKFDAAALTTLGIDFPFEKLEDTLIASHVLASGLGHRLDELVEQYLPPKYDIKKFEKRLDESTESARRIVQQAKLRGKRGRETNEYADWMIAHESLPCMPSLKGTPHKYDLWLPKCIAEHEGYDKDHENYHWHTVLEEYANHDSAVTLMIWNVMERQLKEQGLWKIYRCRMELPYIAKKMEHYGVTASLKEINKLEDEYSEEATYLEKVCVNIAKSYNYELQLPKGPRNANLEKFLFEVMKLPVLEYTEKDKPSLNAEVKERYELTLPKNSKSKLFMESYNRKTELEKAVGTLRSYKKFGVDTDDENYIRLHPNLNITGTQTLQWSSNNPNAQNISKQGTANLRRVFGPEPGREWYSMDGENLQLRIPAFEFDEKEAVEVFLHPERPPYFGSYHLVVFDTLHPELFKKHGKECKVLYEDTWYQWVKNGNFSILFGAQRAKADATFRVDGAYDKIARRFPKIEAARQKYHTLANRQGYVETIPDISQDEKRGYPLMTERNEWQTVSPTIPFCYHIAGTAQQWMYRGMTRCEEKLMEWRNQGFDGWMIIQVHDELVFDFPEGNDPREDVGKLFRDCRSNRWRAMTLRKLLEQGGDHIGVPTPVSVDWHPQSWAVGIAI